MALAALRWGAAAYLSVLLLMTFIERWLVYPAPPVSAGDWSIDGDDLQEAWIDVPPLSEGGPATRLYGRFFDQPDADYAILYCHGNGDDISRLSPLARLMRDRLNASVLVFDYRGYGKSEGTPVEAGVVADGLAAQRWLAERTGRETDQTIVVGRSLGGGVATAIAAEQGAAALVLQSTFTRITDAAATHYPWLPVQMLMRNRFDSLERLSRYEGPVLVSHGTADRVVPFDQGKQLYDAAKGPKSFFEMPEVDHNEPQSASYYDRLGGFLADIR